MTAVGVALYTFYDRGELDVVGADFFIEMIDVERIVGVEVVDDSHGIPFHAMLLQE